MMNNNKFFGILLLIVLTSSNSIKIKEEEKKLITCVIQKAGSTTNISRIVLFDDCSINIQHGSMQEEPMDECCSMDFITTDRNDTKKISDADCCYLRNLIMVSKNEELINDSRLLKDGWLIILEVTGRQYKFYKGLDDSLAIKKIYVKLKELSDNK